MPEFRCFDGEADAQGRYILLAHAGDYIHNLEGLSSESCIRFLTRTRPEAGEVRCFFGLDYDVNMIFRDAPEEVQRGIAIDGQAEYLGWKITYRPRSLLRFVKGHHVVTYVDVMRWFGCSLIQAAKRMGVQVPDIITQGKDARGTWEGWTFDQLVEYNSQECLLVAELMGIMAGRLQRASQVCPDMPSLVPAHWHGPQAIASRILEQIGVREHTLAEEKMEPDLVAAAACAYFGGRIESVQIGTWLEAHLYDIHQAYPHAMTQLTPWRWMWHRVHSYAGSRAIYHVRWKCPRAALGPLPWRHEGTGNVCYPQAGEGWYWGHEVEAALRHYRGIRILEGWQQDAPNAYPMRDPIMAYAEVRDKLKAAGDPAEAAVKLGLNALYGKICQHVGMPRYRSLVWAGQITSITRARILDMIRRNGKHVIAIATDGILTDRELGHVECGPGIGEVDHLPLRDLTAIGAGQYTSDLRTATRGVRRIDWPAALQEIADTGTCALPDTRFVTLRMHFLHPAIYPEPCTWVEQSQRLRPFRGLKRSWPQEEQAELGIGCDLRAGTYRSDIIPEMPGVSAPYDPDRWLGDEDADL
jgi:hypothetical protein